MQLKDQESLRAIAFVQNNGIHPSFAYVLCNFPDQDCLYYTLAIPKKQLLLVQLGLTSDEESEVEILEIKHAKLSRVDWRYLRAIEAIHGKDW